MNAQTKVQGVSIDQAAIAEADALDPAFAHLSPGTVLHAEAMRHLFADRFAVLDFT